MIPPKVFIHHKCISYEDLDAAILQMSQIGYAVICIQPSRSGDPSQLWVTGAKVESIADRELREQEERQRLMRVFPPHLREPLKLGSLETYKYT